jgi:hypothetical protein
MFQPEFDKVVVILLISVIFIGKEFDIEHKYLILPNMGCMLYSLKVLDVKM